MALSSFFSGLFENHVYNGMFSLSLKTMTYNLNYFSEELNIFESEPLKYACNWLFVKYKESHTILSMT